MIHVSSLSNTIPNKITTTSDSVVTILNVLLGSTWIVSEVEGVFRFENNEGFILEITESSDNCVVRGICPDNSTKFPTQNDSSLYWYKTSGEWEIFHNRSFFYFCTENSVHFFGNIESDLCVISGRYNSSEDLFYKYGYHPTMSGYASKSSFSINYFSQPISLVPEFSAINPVWRHPNGSVVINDIEIYDAKKRVCIGHLPYLWVLQPDFPEETLLKTGSGKDLQVLFRENTFLGFEVF